jgi:pimeloyl-ACP methyl ester carboxylesterase
MNQRATPVVFVHGVGLDHTMWDAVLSRMYGDRLLRYDMIAHGQAHAPPGPYRLTDFVDQLATFAANESLGNFDLVGFSMGALVAQGFAAAYPERVRRMVLLNSVFDRTLAEREAVIERVAEVRSGGYSASVNAALSRWFSEEFAMEQPDVVAAVSNRMASNDERAYADAYEVFATADAEIVHVAARIAAPTLVITGSDDARSTPEMAHLLAKAMPDARVHIINGVRHLTPLECPDVVAELIDDFLAQPSQHRKGAK